MVLYLVLQYFGAGGRPVGGRGPWTGGRDRESGIGGRKRAASINKVFSLAGGLGTGLSFYGV